MNFHKGSIKLASLYLAIMMAISLFFSINIYQLSVQEFDKGLRRPGLDVTIPIGPAFTTELRDQLIQEHEQRFEDARDSVINRLIIINLLILLGGGILSYYLALRTLKPIEEAHKSLERFTADASHELRTPITAIRSENEVALMDPKMTLAEAKKLIKSNIEELEKLTELSDGLLRLASLENYELQTTEVSIASVTNKAVDRIKTSAEKKKIKITKVVEDKAKVDGDEASLTEALVILLDNAIKYSPENTEITIRTYKKQKQAVMQVTDQGVGIKSTELSHIFDRFYRADSSRSKQNTSGYGLGLAIAKNIVDSHGGVIDAKSDVKKGSTFTVSLPAKA